MNLQHVNSLTWFPKIKSKIANKGVFTIEGKHLYKLKKEDEMAKYLNLENGSNSSIPKGLVIIIWYKWLKMNKTSIIYIKLNIAIIKNQENNGNNANYN